MSDPKPITPPSLPHQATLDAIAAILKDRPEAAEAMLDSLNRPKPGEFPKYVNGTTCANRADERRALALGPAVGAPRPLSDWDKVAAAFDQQNRNRAAVQAGHVALASAVASGARMVSSEELAELQHTGRVVRKAG